MVHTDTQRQTQGTKVHDTEILATDTPQQYREKLARITLDSMVQFVGLLDVDGTVLEINKVALDAVGIKLSDVEGKPFWTTFWWQVSEEVNRGLRESIAAAAKGEFVRWDTAIYRRAGGTETIVIDASLCPVMDDRGRVVFIAAEGRDITAKKAYEREIAQKNLELQALLERIRELDDIKTQFFANVSHELRTPLTLILGPAQRLMEDVGAMTPDQRRESAGVIGRNARVLLKHVNDLLDLSKLEAGKLKIELQDTDVAALVRLVASHFEVLAHDRAIDFRLEIPDQIISAVDPDKLERVLMNLLSNAFKFTPGRGKDGQGGTILCSLKADGERLTLSVEDSGPGVRPELRRAIFERFRQGDGGADRQFGGTGLGLAIAKEFVEMHRGTVVVLDSNLGGALFQVVLPRQRLHADRFVPSDQAGKTVTAPNEIVAGTIEELRANGPRPEEVRVPQASVARSPGRATILVVEDNVEMNRFVSDSLRGEYDVICAYDGREGLEKALAARPAIIVSDIMMPIMSGAEMVREIRQRPELADVGVLVLSARADEELKVDLLEGGTQDFIVKPFSEKDLQVRVRNLIAIQRALERERQEAATNQSLYRVAASFANELDQQRLLQLVTDEATALTGAEFGSFFFNAKREDGEAYLLYTLSGAPPEAFASFPMPRATPIFGPTFRGEGVIRLDDVRKDPRYGQWGRQPEGHLPVVSYLAVPVVGAGGDVLGGLFFGHGQPARFTEAHERVALGLAAQAAAALEKVRLYRALRESEARAREADRRKDEFLAMLGHELRNPLAPIMTALQLMDLRGETGSVKERQVIERQVKHLSRLVDDLLDIARVTRGKIQVTKQRISLTSVVEKAVEMASPLLEQKGHKLRLAVVRHGLAVDGDQGRLAQVVSNLLTNAAKFTDPGGSIVLAAYAKDDRVVVSVKDNGQGIAPELLGQVFDLFVQGPRTSDRAQGGLGIGLALVRNLVELHGGRVYARSEGPGRGSEFLFELPAARGESLTASSAESARIADRPRLQSQILLVDDNNDAASILAETLKYLGHDVLIANDGPQALAVAETFCPTMALLDIGLPIMDGYELARLLRAVWREQPVRFVAITGYGQEADKERASAAGFEAHLVKPVDIGELVMLLEPRSATDKD
jgi:PAS domain S-box-containing protein